MKRVFCIVFCIDGLTDLADWRSELILQFPVKRCRRYSVLYCKVPNQLDKLIRYEKKLYFVQSAYDDAFMKDPF